MKSFQRERLEPLDFAGSILTKASGATVRGTWLNVAAPLPPFSIPLASPQESQFASKFRKSLEIAGQDLQAAIQNLTAESTKQPCRAPYGHADDLLDMSTRQE